VSKQVPLTTLLSWAWISFSIEADNAFEASGAARVGRHFRISLPMWTNGLRFIDGNGVKVDDLRSLARASCNLGGLERWGWISVGDGAGERRDGYGTQRGIRGATIVRPTRAGLYARRLWPRVLIEVEDRWRMRFGGEAVDALRDALLAVAAPMPWSPPETHPSDGFYTHIVDGDDSDEVDRPLVALMGQALTAFTLDHEGTAAVSLPLGANVLRVTGSGDVRVQDLPALTGISKEGIAMAVGFLQRNGLACSVPERPIRLTSVGRQALDGYWRSASRARNKELRAALETVVVQRSALAAGLVPPPGCWRGQKAYLGQTQRLLANPTAALPWHPLVLHRGAWPDAS
jgi:hypothetical protein